MFEDRERLSLSQASNKDIMDITTAGVLLGDTQQLTRTHLTHTEGIINN